MGDVVVLDVGCGHAWKGDVNVDLFTKPTKHRMLGLPDPDAPDVPLSKTPNLIRADGTHLPLRANCFEEVVSYHLIEHVDDPFRLLREMARVAKPNGTVTVETPHRLAHRRQWSLHKHSFTRRWFEAAFRKLNIQMVDSHTSYKYYPHPYFPIIQLPYFIRFIGKVKK